MTLFAYMEMRVLLALLACLSFASVQAADGVPANTPAAKEDALSILRRAVETTAATNSTAPVAVPPTAPKPPPEILDDTIKLNPGDILRFKIVEDREEVKALRVTDAGDLDFPYIGPVPAKGRTCKEIAQDAKARLEADYYYTATVSLAVEQVLRKTGGRIWVTGQVGSQGPQEIPTDEVWTVYKAILRAGGFNDFANRGKVKVFRKTRNADGSERQDQLVVDVADVMKGKSDKDLVVQDGDNIIVESQLINFR